MVNELNTREFLGITSKIGLAMFGSKALSSLDLRSPTVVLSNGICVYDPIEIKNYSFLLDGKPLSWKEVYIHPKDVKGTICVLDKGDGKPFIRCNYLKTRIKDFVNEEMEFGDSFLCDQYDLTVRENGRTVPVWESGYREVLASTRGCLEFEGFHFVNRKARELEGWLKLANR